MTSRQCFEGLLAELSKVNAPSMLLSDFNYFFNKAINQYINKRYNIYDVNQQTSDDLRVLKSTAILKPVKSFDVKTISNTTEYSGTYGNIKGDLSPEELQSLGLGTSKLLGGNYEVNLPLDYLHLLNCVCVYTVKSKYKCYDVGDTVQFGAKRLTADAWPVIINDYYNRPLPERPYFYIHNVNQSADLPTNPISSNILSRSNFSGTDPYILKNLGELPKQDSSGKSYMVYLDENNKTYYLDEQGSTIHCVLNNTNTQIMYECSPNDATQIDIYPLPRKIKIGNLTKDLVEKDAGIKHSNPTNVRMEIRYGHDSDVFELKAVLIDYIKSPQVIRLTQTQVNKIIDESQIMEFPDYVCQEIINELVHLVMETTGDPRLQTHSVVTQSIGNPVQQQAQ